MKILAARWVCSIDAASIEDGAIAIQADRIAGVGKAAAMLARFPGALVERFSNAAIVPGLVNPHVHLELSALTPRHPPPSDFVDWLLDLMAKSRVDESHLKSSVGAAIDIGVAQCLRFGVTTVGDISRQCRITRPRLAESPLRVVSFGEVQAMATRRTFLAERLAVAADSSCATDRLTIGITPHAPYSIEPEGFHQCLARSRDLNMSLATHLAESAGESEFLSRHTGQFRKLWDTLGWWDDAVPHFNGGPIRLAESLGLLAHPTLLAHVNYCDDAELAILGAGSASVVYCPRTHAYFNHPPHRWRDMLGAGINVAIGTDSCASSPDLNLLDDLRLVHRLSPQTPAADLWKLATLNAAKALGMQNRVGSIAAGKFADLIAFDATGADPLLTILDSAVEPTRVWIGGRQVG